MMLRFLVLLFAMLVLGLPHGRNIGARSGGSRSIFDLNTNNSAGSDPINPPATCQARHRLAGVNPFAGKLVATPDSCTDFERPSDQCLSDLMGQEDGVVAFSGGSVKFRGCKQHQREAIETAVWDALTLSAFIKDAPTSAKDIATWKTWIGPDYSAQQQRILGKASQLITASGPG